MLLLYYLFLGLHASYETAKELRRGSSGKWRKGERELKLQVRKLMETWEKEVDGCKQHWRVLESGGREKGS